MTPSNRTGTSLISARTRATLNHSKRLTLVYGLCLILLSSVTPLFAQRRTAIRVRAGEATKPAARPSEKEREREPGQSIRARRASGQSKQDGKLPYKPVSSDADTVGEPTTGEVGIEKRMSAISAEQAVLEVEKDRVPRLIPEHHGPNRRALPQDPNAVEAASMVNGRPVTLQKVKGVVAKQASSLLAPQTVSTPNFTAATLADTGAFPPDTMGAIGPTQFFAFLNGRLRTFNKTTGAADGVVNVDSDVFFASVMSPFPGGGLNFTSDPNVRYDRLTRRWFVSIIDVPSSSPSSIGDIPNRLLLAVSDAASNGVISGGTIWTYYFVQQDLVGVGVSTGEFLDYPSLGIDEDALYIGGNMFGAVSGSFVNCTGFVIRKSSVLSGGPIVTTAFRAIVPNVSSDGPFSPRGVDNYATATNEGYFIGVSNTFFGRLIIRRVTDPDTTPTISANILLTITSTSSPITVDHLDDTGGANGNLDALDDRLYAAHIRGGRLWTAHNIAVTSAGAASNTNGQRRNAVRWYELAGVRSTDNGGTPIVVQSGTIFDTATTVATARQYWIPSVMVSGQGHAAFGYSTAGSPFRIDAATNGRLRGDTLGTSGAPELYTASSTAYNPPSDPGPTRRWGDYSFTSLDPQDDMTMWTIQEFCNATNSYGVRAVRLLAPPPATPTTGVPGSVAQNTPSANVVITGTSVAGSEFYDPGTDVPGAEPFNHISATVSGGVVVNSITYDSPTQVTLNISTVGATAGPQSVTITNPDGQSTIGAGVITVTGPTVTAGQVLISEFRFRGPSSGGDEFVELYNNTNSDLDISGGTLWALTAAGAQTLRFTVPGAVGSNTNVIPARGHYLIAGASYSLAGSTASNGTLSADIIDGSAIALFAGATTATTRLDSAGFDNRDPLFFEGTPLSPSGAGTGGITVGGEYSFFRKLTTGLPQDTGDNDADFAFVSINGGTFSTRASTLGAPGPENLASPIQRNTTIKASVVDTGASSNATPNRVRDVGSYTDTLTPSAPNGGVPASNPYTNGTLSIRRKFTNNTGGAVTKLRFRIVDATTFPPPGGVADLRGLSSSTIVVSLTGGGTATVQGLTLEQVPAQPMGGGLNSTLSAGTVTLGSPIVPGASINVQFLLGVVSGGTFRFFINVEAVP